MLTMLLALALAMAPGASRFPPEAVGQLSNGARIFKPADSVSVREETPEMFKRLAARYESSGQPLLDVFMSPNAFEQWEATGDIKAVAGTNTLLVHECKMELPPADGRAQTLTAVAEALRAHGEKRRAARTDGKAMEFVYGPAAGSDRIVTIVRTPHVWPGRSGMYLLSTVMFWPEGRCLSLSLDGEDDANDAVRTQKRMIDMLADLTLELVNP